jgi:hypothetical protein
MICDYVLVYRGQKLGVIEAKKPDAGVTEGLGRASEAYAKSSKCDGELTALLELKYGHTSDAIAHLGSATAIREAFIGFQRRLYVAPGHS